MTTRKRHSAQRFNEVISIEGVDYPLVVVPGRGWRMRKRSARGSVDYFTGTTNKTVARRLAREYLERRSATGGGLATATLADVVAAYKQIPKHAGPATEKPNRQRLAAVARTVTGRDLKRVYHHEIGPHFWEKFQAVRQGLPRPDLSTRRPEHTTINTAVRVAVLFFIEKLRPKYAARGIVIPSSA